MSRELRVTLDAGGARGLVRVSRRTLHALDLRPGDVVRIEGGRPTHGRVVPGIVASNTAELDTALAGNAGVEAGAQIVLHRVDLPPLEALVLRIANGRAASHVDFREALFDMALSEGDRLPLGGEPACETVAEIVSLSPSPAGILQESTAVSIEAPPDPQMGYAGVGGLAEQIASVHDMISAPLLRPELYDRLGITPPRGVLFSGPPGSGKTLLARAVANKTKAAFFHINGPEIVTKHYGDSEAALRKTFAAAEKSSPAIIFIDEIDAIAPARSGLSEEKQVERRIVAQLLTLMDGLSDRGRIVVMAATNLPDALDPALRRPGRFDREIAFRPPSADQRAEILQVHLAKSPLAADVDLATLAAKSHGYVGADLAALAREAAVAALTRTVKAAGGDAQVRVEDLEIRQIDLEHGLSVTTPSMLREARVETAPVAWKDVGGLAEAKDALRQAVLAPIEHQEDFARYRLRPPRGILLCGPPGSGKTLTARALAAETGMNFVPVRPPKLLSQYFGAAERAVADLFSKARLSAPTLLFFDEFDAIAPRRSGKDAVLDRIVAQFLMEMDGVEANAGLVVLAATNRPSAIDPALLRPGRFDVVLDFPLPDRAARLDILEVHMAGRPLADDVDLAALAGAADGLSGADLATLCNGAAQRALARSLAGAADQHGITRGDLDAALLTLRAAEDIRTRDFLQKETANGQS